MIFCNRLCRLPEQEFSLMLNLGHSPLYRSGDALVPERIRENLLLWRGRGRPLSQSGTRASPLPLYRLLRENFQFIFRVNRKKLNFMLKNGVLTTFTLSLSAAFDSWLRNSSPMKIWIDWVALGSIWLLPPLMVIVSVVMINSWGVV